MATTIVDLNDDVLERIFTFLDFKDLLAAELCCLRWKSLIVDRRLFRQLSRQICKKSIRLETKFSQHTFTKHLKNIKAYRVGRVTKIYKSIKSHIGKK